MRRLRRQLFGWSLPISRIELRKIALHALLQLGAASLHLPAREVLVAGIDCLELAAIDRNARLRQQPHQAVGRLKALAPASTRKWRFSIGTRVDQSVAT